MKFENVPPTSESHFNTPDSHASYSHFQPPPASSTFGFGFENMDALSHLHKIEALQAAHRAEQERKRIEEEERKKLDAELFGEGEGEGDVQMTTEEAGGEVGGGGGGELILENPEVVERQDTVMADGAAPEPARQAVPVIAVRIEDLSLPPPECFVNAPQPGTSEREGCTEKIGYGKRAACAVLGDVNLEAKRVAAVVTSYADGVVAMALISPPWGNFELGGQSIAGRLFGDDGQRAGPTVAGGAKEPESTVIGPDTAMRSPLKSGHVLALTGYYYGRKKVAKLLEMLHLADEPLAVISRATSEYGKAVSIIGKQKTSRPVLDIAESGIDLSHEIAELQYEARMAYIVGGGSGEALDNELENLQSEHGDDGADEPLSPQSAGRGNKPTSLAAMVAQAQTPNAAPKRGAGGGRARGGAKGKRRGESKAKAHGRK